MTKTATCFLAAMAAFIAGCLCGVPARAQAVRTFVSGHGADSGTCGLGAPCRTFAYAITQTNAGGEIAVLDTAGYGTVTIDRAISINNPGGVEAGISVGSGGSAITVNANANDSVSLRGLSLNGGGVGQFGIVFASGQALQIVGCVVRDFTDTGIFIVPSAGVTVLVSDTFVLDNAKKGIQLETLSNSSSIIAAFNQVTASNNSTGFNTFSAGGLVEAEISNSHIDNNVNYGIALSGSTGGNSNVVVQNSTINQTPIAVLLNGFATLWVSHVTQPAVPGLGNVGVAMSGSNNTMYSDGTNHFNLSFTPLPWSFQ
jgi:hypothetical protein